MWIRSALSMGSVRILRNSRSRSETRKGPGHPQRKWMAGVFFLIPGSEVSGEIVQDNGEVVIGKRSSFVEHGHQCCFPFVSGASVMTNPVQFVALSTNFQHHPFSGAIRQWPVLSDEITDEPRNVFLLDCRALLNHGVHC